MEPKSFNELIGTVSVLNEWKECFRQITKGDIVYVSGYSGVGKTIGTKLLIEEFGYNPLYLDTNIANDSKDVYDRIEKFHNWSEIGATNTAKKIIIVDEIETFIKFDRNIFNSILAYAKTYKTSHIPLVLISHTDVLKKLGDMKNFIKYHIKLNRLDDVQIFLYFKQRIPRNKLKVNDLMTIVENGNGNIYAINLSILNRIGNKNKLITNYIGDEQKTFQEIFECKNPTIVEKLLTDDDWMNPLKIHENIIKILDTESYICFLEKYLCYEMWHSVRDDYFLSDIPMIYLTYVILLSKKITSKIDTMEFSKLLSYISTKKKYRKLMYDKVPISYPIEDLGLYWINKKNIL
jgi:hypothetical protein